MMKNQKKLREYYKHKHNKIKSIIKTKKKTEKFKQKFQKK